MPPRNAKTPIRRLIGLSASLAALALSPLALAQQSEKSFLSIFLPSPSADSQTAGNAPLSVQEIRVAPQLASTIDLTVHANNLWDRIRNGFAMTNLNDNLVLHYQQWYQNRPDALRRMVERSRPYLHYIVEELEARGMPTELAFLPMVESSFNPMAYSRSNASGLWQFIPATGKRFKLEQDWWHDERRDVIASTNAALDYLQSIYDMHGDWHLALASYNWGEGAVKRAIEKNESRGLPTDYPNLTMPNETRHYVPKLQALKNIFANPGLTAQLGIPAIANEPYLAMMEAGRPMDVKTAARLANMSLEEFRHLNPSHNRPVIRPDAAVVLPAEKMATFRANLESQQAPLTHWQAYTVTSAERLDQIAPRFGATASELAQVNGLSEKVRLAAGSTLLVPGNTNGQGLSNLFSTGPQVIIAPEPVSRPCPKGAKTAQKCGKPGDTAVPSRADKTGDKKGDTKVAAKGNDASKSKPEVKGKPESSTKHAAGKPAPAADKKPAPKPVHAANGRKA